MSHCVLGFNGERRDPVGGAAHLGNGYRTYSPALMRFHCPDSLSPFGAGGVNAYGYCAGDPVNRADPSGHLGWQAWTGIGLGVAGLALAAISAASAIVAAGGVIAAIESTSAIALTAGALGVVVDVTAIACGATEEADPQASAILGWVSLGAGAAGVVRGAYALGRRVAGMLERSDIFHIALGVDEEFRSPAIMGITWGNVMGEWARRYRLARNEGLPADLAYRFRDTAQNGDRRLNIVAHRVELAGSEHPGRLQIGSKLYPADALPEFLEKSGIDLNKFHQIRIISCYSSDIARHFAELTGKVTIGYRGPVAITGRASDFAHVAIRDLSANHPEGALADINKAFRQRYDHYAYWAMRERRAGAAFYRVDGDEDVFLPISG
ncbi:RHS repeat-associated core domain-containing protein [Chromobacterium sp. CV08]|uniref:RHS repeat-associated core domain-containing protein n=1 Tax=Chromobacterium sp. CV08 TaxID=3133274 RepID=UPI003DA95105